MDLKNIQHEKTLVSIIFERDCLIEALAGQVQELQNRVKSLEEAENGQS